MEERVSQGRGGEKEGEEDESEGEGERGLRFHPIPADPIFLSPVKWQSADRWLLAVTLRLLMRHFSIQSNAWSSWSTAELSFF